MIEGQNRRRLSRRWNRLNQSIRTVDNISSGNSCSTTPRHTEMRLFSAGSSPIPVSARCRCFTGLSSHAVLGHTFKLCWIEIYKKKICITPWGQDGEALTVMWCADCSNWCMCEKVCFYFVEKLLRRGTVGRQRTLSSRWTKSRQWMHARQYQSSSCRAQKALGAANDRLRGPTARNREGWQTQL